MLRLNFQQFFHHLRQHLRHRLLKLFLSLLVLRLREGDDLLRGEISNLLHKIVVHVLIHLLHERALHLQILEFSQLILLLLHVLLLLVDDPVQHHVLVLLNTQLLVQSLLHQAQVLLLLAQLSHDLVFVLHLKHLACLACYVTRRKTVLLSVPGQFAQVVLIDKRVELSGHGSVFKLSSINFNLCLVVLVDHWSLLVHDVVDLSELW